MAADKYNVEGTLAYAQRVAIEEALHECGFNISRAAKRLQIGRTTLYNLIEKYRIFGVRPGENVKSIRSTSIGHDGHEIIYLDGSWYLRSSGTSMA